jgi:DNA-directed RNA polymerase I subunit RPA43
VKSGIFFSVLMSGFKKVNSKLQIHLSPIFMGKIAQGINDYLLALVTKYVFELQGVVLSFSGIKVLQTKSIIKTESPFMHFNVSVDFIVFCPLVGDRYIGIVNKVSPDHIGCLVHGFFNASIAADQFTQNLYRWDHESHMWTSKTNSIKPGSVIQFSIIKYFLIDE